MNKLLNGLVAFVILFSVFSIGYIVTQINDDLQYTETGKVIKK